MRSVHTLANQQSAVSGTLSFALDVEAYHTIGVVIYASTVAATATLAVTDDFTTSRVIKSASVTAGTADATLSIGREVGIGTFCVPRKIVVAGTAGAGGTVQISIYGVIDEPDNV